MTPRVSLVGAGPGDPELLTRRAWHRLRRAEAVFHDGLVPASIVKIANRAQRISVARRAGPKTITDDAVVEALIASASAGKRTVRLKAGDPFVLGRGRDEIAALAAAGIVSEVVPGITSATAAPLLAGIPLTARGISAAFLVVSGHSADAFGPPLRSLAPGSATVVVLMGMGQRAGIRDALLSAGWDPATPAAVVANASRNSQREWFGSLRDLAASPPKGLRSPGVIVIGPAVAAAVPGNALHGRKKS